MSPAHALPGETVRVSGVAPLTSVIGASEPFVSQTQTLRGRAAGPQVHFRVSDGLDEVTFGHAALRVIAPPRYGALRHLAPIAEVSDGVAPVAADPANPCAGGVV